MSGPRSAAWRSKLQAGRSSIGRAWKTSALRVAGMLLFTAILGTGTFIVFDGAFAFLYERLDILGPILLVRLLSVFFFTLFLMLLMSNTLVAFQTFYRSREADFWTVSPLSDDVIWSIRSLEIAVYASWAFLVLGAPLLIAYGRGTQAGLAYYLVLPIVLVFFCSISHFLGTALSIALVRFFPGLDFKRLLALLFVGLTPFVLYVIEALRIGDIRKDQDGTELVAQALETLSRTQFPLLPGYWSAEALRAASLAEWGRAGLLLWSLVVTAVFAGLLSREIASRWLRLSYQNLKGRGLAKPLRRRTRKRQLVPAAGPLRALALKDVKLFLREPSQWSQVALVAVLSGIYVGNLRNLPDLSRFDLWGNVAAWLNLGVTMLLVATLTTRFAFPLISMEGRRAWVVFLSPLPRRSLVVQKLLLALPLALCFGTIAVALSQHVLGVSQEMRLPTHLVVAGAAFALSGLAVGLGALFPNFKEDNPARIVSGFGGTLNFLIGMAYVLVLTLLLGAPSVMNALGRIDESTRTSWEPITVVLALGTSLVVGVVPLILGRRHLENFEL